MNRIHAVVGLTVCFGMLGAAHADTFVLNSGKTFEGTVMRQEGNRFTIRTAKGISTYQLHEFDETTRARIEGSQRSEDASAPEARPSTPSATGRRPAPAAGAEASAGGGEKTLVACMVAGVILMVVGSLWFIVAGFAESPLWGIALLLFNGIAGLAFLILHFDRAKKPVFCWFLGAALFVAGLLLLERPLTGGMSTLP